MQSRFGLKDAAVLVLLVAVLASIWLRMHQVDRFYVTYTEKLSAVEGRVQALGNAQNAGVDMAALDARLAELKVALAQTGSVAELDARLAKIEAMLAQGVRVADSGAHPGGGAGAAENDPTKATGSASTNDPSTVSHTAPKLVDLPAGNPPWEETYPGRVQLARDMPGFAEGDAFNATITSGVKKVTPFVYNEFTSSYIQGFVLESLATRDPETLEFMPRLASAWIKDDDKLEYTFRLRTDARFSDGEPVTADDVIFTYNLILDPKLANPQQKPYYAAIAEVTKLDDRTVRFKMAEPYFLGFEVCAGLVVLPEHWYGQFTIEEINEEPGLLMGSGPYRLPGDPLDWKANGPVVELVRNENYWGPQPGLDVIRFRVVSDPSARLTEFRNGNSDIFGVPPDKYDDLVADEGLLARSDLLEYETITTGYRYIGWNQVKQGEPTLFTDKRVRRALTHLIDRERINDTVMRGLATVTRGPFHRKNPQSSPNVKPLPYDLELGLALLAEAGFADRDGDGVIENEAGQPLKFKLMYPSGSDDYNSMAKAVQDDLARAGIRMELDPTEWGTMLQKIQKRDFDASSLGWTRGIEGDLYQIWHSDSIAEGGSNAISYSNPQLDALIEQARMTLDDESRLAMWQRCHEIIHEDQPYTFMFTRRTIQLVDQRFGNVDVTRTGLNDRREWFVPSVRQKPTP